MQTSIALRVDLGHLDVDDLPHREPAGVDPQLAMALVSRPSAGTWLTVRPSGAPG